MLGGGCLVLTEADLVLHVDFVLFHFNFQFPVCSTGRLILRADAFNCLMQLGLTLSVSNAVLVSIVQHRL